MVDLLTPRQTSLPSRLRLEEEIVVDQVNFTLTLCLPETKSRIGLICANCPINLTDPTGLDRFTPVPSNPDILMPGDDSNPFIDPNVVGPNNKCMDHSPITDNPFGNPDIINGPFSALWHYLFGGGNLAVYGPGFTQALQELAIANTSWFHTSQQPVNLSWMQYGSMMHPYDTFLVVFTLGQFRYTDDGTFVNISDTYAFPFSQSDHYGGTTYHNIGLYYLFYLSPGEAYNDSGVIINPP